MNARLYLLCRYNWTTDPKLIPIAALMENDTESFLQDAAHTLDLTFLTCTVFGVETNCSDILKQVPTDGGM